MQTRNVCSLMRLAWVMLVAVGAGCAQMPSTGARAADAQVKVVYHLNEGTDQSVRALRNIDNHLQVDPTVKIVVVAHGPGIDFLLKDAHKPSGEPFAPDIDALAARGVEFDVCNNTLQTRHIDPSRVLPLARIVPSGVAEVARLQAREGFVYVRP